MNRKNFTLVELLVVIAIIIVLAGILFPAIQSALKKAEIAKARAGITTLMNAIKQYESTYGKLPCPKDYAKSSDKEPCLTDDQYEWMVKILQGESVSDDDMGDSSKFNKRNIKFLDVQGNEPGKYLDPWDKNYKVILDVDYNGNIEPASGSLDGVDASKVYYSVIIWSQGDDGASAATKKDKKNKDNVYSFSTSWHKDNGHVITKEQGDKRS